MAYNICHLNIHPVSWKAISFACLCLLLSFLSLSVSLYSVPGHVQKLQVHHSNESSVCVQWRSPLGEWDTYSVYLTDVGGGVRKRQTLSREINEFSFHDLTPGKEYNITVVTHSGDLNSSTSITTQTSKTHHLQTSIDRINWRTGPETRVKN